LIVRNPFLDPVLALCRTTEFDVRFETGLPVRFRFVRSVEKSPNFGPMYGQDIEPVGRYMLHNPDPRELPPTWETGMVSFYNPLVLALSTDDRIYGPNGWKARLVKVFGSRRKALSCKLRRLGIDGIVTCDSDNRGRISGTREIVDLTSVRC
jgi:hypothetical protein